jgi:hypothetical protein
MGTAYNLYRYVPPKRRRTLKGERHEGLYRAVLALVSAREVV